MPVDFTGMNTALAALTSQVATTVGTTKSAIVLLNGMATAITTAIAADETLTAAQIKTATDAIAGVNSQFASSAADLGAAVAANPGPGPGPGPNPGPPVPPAKL